MMGTRAWRKVVSSVDDADVARGPVRFRINTIITVAKMPSVKASSLFLLSSCFADSAFKRHSSVVPVTSDLSAPV